MPLQTQLPGLNFWRPYQAIAARILIPIMLAFSIAVPAPGLAAVSADRFARLQAQDLRAASIAYRLATSNRARCATSLAPQLGLVLHAIEQYAGDDRLGAARKFGLGDHIGVMAVVAGSPAGRGAIESGDQLVAINGRAVRPRASSDAGRMRTDETLASLQAAAQRGAVMLEVSGPGGDRTIELAAQPGCPASVELLAGSGVNAWADGDRIMIGEQLIRSCNSDDDLAFVIAHELAHNLLRHRERLAANPDPVLMRQTELEADQLALQLASTAGYDMSGVATFMGTLLHGRELAVSHPGSKQRLQLLHAAIDGRSLAAARQRTGVALPLAASANTASSGSDSGKI